MDDIEDVESSSDSELSDSEDSNSKTKVYLPGQTLKEGERLVADQSAYVLYHQAQTGSPCLSFDILRDDYGDSRDEYPLTANIVAGTQAQSGKSNHVIVMKMSNLNKNNKAPGDESDEDSDDEESEIKPMLETAMVLHHGGVNRIRCTKVKNRNLAATWSERASVHIWDLTRLIGAVSEPSSAAGFIAEQKKHPILPAFTFAGHMDEGFALDWSPSGNGQLLTGDCKSNIHLWKPQEDGTWHVDQRPFAAHSASVEEVQWSPNEKSVFASCSVDKTIRIWDTRASPLKACMLTTKAHDADVNVMNWNKNDPFIVSGGDDGVIKVWDLRQFNKGKAIASFKHHTSPITSVEWHPTDKSIFAACGGDDQLTQWDLAVELDEISNEKNDNLKDVPPQLLFIHQGQKDIKELHWHPQIPGLIISTALDGFNVFRTISV
nr:glutamate-rich WD repeat-containing protein 1 [Ciona intestinalis]|eukprot:XP_026692017.1 glutamate-rich WD repeat-containing protein 1 [Ciona intestinalis]